MPYFSAQIPITFSQALCTLGNRGHYQPSISFARCTTSVFLLPTLHPTWSILTISRPKFRPTMIMFPAQMSLHQTCLSSLAADPIYFINHLFHCMAHNPCGEDKSKTTPKMLPEQYSFHSFLWGSHIHNLNTYWCLKGCMSNTNKHPWASLFLRIYLIKLGLLHPQANSRWAATLAVCAENSV